MSIKLPKVHQRLIWKYLQFHDGETILQKNISLETGVGTHTVSRDLKWMEKRGLIKRDGKNIHLIG